MPYRVVFTPESRQQLTTLFEYIQSASSATIAERYTSAIVDFCEALTTFPYRVHGAMMCGQVC